ncbi:MAG TPA: PQQ-binding-like beta-propeller repeat protein [Ktedonobacterales bacterium]|nr:PQQ-binding-like beta-propeller repeat protein [Ktedonobacterales bacterium]
MYGANSSKSEYADGQRARVRHLMLACLLAPLLLLAFGGCDAPVAPHPSPHIDSALSILTQHTVLRASDGTVRWTGDLGIDPPTVSGGVAYTETFTNVMGALSARRIEDGSVLWTYQIQDTMGPITLANGLVVLSTWQSDGLVLVALQASTGNVVWRSASIPAVVRRSVDTSEPFMSQPVFSAGYIIAALDSAGDTSFVVAWNVTDGSVAWQEALSDATPYAGVGAHLEVFGSSVVTWYDGGGFLAIGALDPHTGARTWSITEDEAGAVIVAHRVIVITQPASFTVTAVRPSDGTTLWRWRPTPHPATLPNDTFGLRELSADDSAILLESFDRPDTCASGTLTSAVTRNPDLLSHLGCPQLFAVNVTTGSLLWRHTLDVTPFDSLWSVAGNGAFYYKYVNDKLPETHYILMSFDANGGALRWKQEIGGYTRAESAHDGVLYSLFQAGLATDRKVTALDAASGEYVWTSTIGGPNDSSHWLMVA